MPIRINLKELFPADPQEITVDKINFNFNKLLELGVGEEGPIGNSGIRGAAGPSGNLGGQGLRGSTWYVDSVANPNSLTITDLIAGDFYLNSTTFAVWQYDGTQWNFLFDLTQIINSYLAASPSPFQRGIGIGTPDDERFIRFTRRDAFPNDQLGSSVSTNDTLFLNNFDEEIINPFVFGPALTPSGTQIPTSDLYNSLLSIVVDGRTPLTQRRYHLELGDLYLDGADPKITTKDENLKVRFSKESSSGYDPGILYYGLASFSLDTHLNLSGRVVNGVFEWITPKYSALEVVDAKNITLIGSKYGLREFTANDLKADGLLFINDGGQIANAGVAEDFLITNYPANTGYVVNNATRSYLMLDPVSGIDAIYLDDNVYQNGGNIIQLGTSEPREKSSVSPINFAHNNEIFSDFGVSLQGETIYAFGGQLANANPQTGALNGKTGHYTKINLNNPNAPTIQRQETYTFNSSTPQIIGPGISDIEVIGDKMYVAVNQSVNFTPNPLFNLVSGLFVFNLDSSSGTTLPSLIFRSNPFVSNIPVSARSGVGFYTMLPLERAHRIKKYGDKAVIATNALTWRASVSGFNNPITGFNNPNGQTEGLISLVDLTSTNFLAGTVFRTLGITALDEDLHLTGLTTEWAHLDIDVVDDWVYSLVWEQRPSGANARVTVYVKQYNLKDLQKTTTPPSTSGTPTIPLNSRANIRFFNSTVNSTQWNLLSKTGAVCANSKNVYAAYSVYDSSTSQWSINLQVLQLNPLSNNQLIVISTSQILSNLTSFSNVRDIKILGNSLYVVASYNIVGNQLKIFKLDVSNPNQPTLIWTKDVTDSANGKIVISGKHVYCVCQAPVAGGKIVTLDYDGIYTSGAHIESLRSDSITVTKDIDVSNDVRVHNNLMIGKNASISRDLGVSGDVSIDGVFRERVRLVNPSSEQRFSVNRTIDSPDFRYLQNNGTIATIYGSTGPESAPDAAALAAYPFDRYITIIGGGSSTSGSSFLNIVSQDANDTLRKFIYRGEISPRFAQSFIIPAGMKYWIVFDNSSTSPVFQTTLTLQWRKFGHDWWRTYTGV